MLKIGDFSRLSQISIRMLRHYDELGLLIPESTDPFTGYRYYGEAQLSDARKISMLKAMGFPLAEIVGDRKSTRLNSLFSRTANSCARIFSGREKRLRRRRKFCGGNSVFWKTHWGESERMNGI